MHPSLTSYQTIFKNHLFFFLFFYTNTHIYTYGKDVNIAILQLLKIYLNLQVLLLISSFLARNWKITQRKPTPVYIRLVLPWLQTLRMTTSCKKRLLCNTHGRTESALSLVLFYFSLDTELAWRFYQSSRAVVYFWVKISTLLSVMGGLLPLNAQLWDRCSWSSEWRKHTSS